MELIKNRNDLSRNSNHSLKDLPNNFCCMISNYDRELVLSYLKISKYYKKYNDQGIQDLRGLGFTNIITDNLFINYFFSGIRYKYMVPADQSVRSWLKHNSA